MKTTIKLMLAALAVGAGAMLAWGQSPTEGEVRKVDTAHKKITLKHGEIKNLDLPPMIATFAVQNDAMLGKVKPGDKVRFTADKIGGTYTLTTIEVAK